MLDRRKFLGALAIPAAAPLAACLARPRRVAEAIAAAAADQDSARSPEDAAADEDFWFQVQQAWDVDRSQINLNNGGVCPSPGVVLEAMERHLAFSNTLPAFAMWQVLEPQRENVRQRVAAEWGVDPEEIAFTRNASESLQIMQLGLDLARGDEVLTTTQDYPRMLTTFRQRERREGIVLRQVKIPTPCEDDAEVVRRFERGIGDKTRMILVCQVINLTGQVLPVREIAALGAARGIPVVVDGAHGFAHLDFRLPDLGCDNYSTSLHKWLCAPHGTGLLWLRRDKIRGVWPLMAAGPELDGNIRKFEEIGTHPAANALAIAEALVLHQAIGGARKHARLVHLRDHWAKRLVAASDRVRLHTSLAPGRSTGVACVEVLGLDSAGLQAWLWSKHKIFTVAIDLPGEFQGLRISPNVYTTPGELDRFCDAVEHAIREGLPS
jgi:selenocysteine lyase/cysteine desulfurase